jgi:hypothetical protein
MAKRDILTIEGICFPVIPDHVRRIFIKKKILFPKISVHNVLPLYCQVGQKLFFYQSHTNKEIVGEGIIKEIALLTYDQFLSRINESFLNSEEFRNYVNNRLDKKIMAFKISNLLFYNKPIKPPYYVTMGGRYITKKEYSNWGKKFDKFNEGK